MRTKSSILALNKVENNSFTVASFVANKAKVNVFWHCHSQATVIDGYHTQKRRIFSLHLFRLCTNFRANQPFRPQRVKNVWNLLVWHVHGCKLNKYITYIRKSYYWHLLRTGEDLRKDKDQMACVNVSQQCYGWVQNTVPVFLGEPMICKLYRAWYFEQVVGGTTQGLVRGIRI